MSRSIALMALVFVSSAHARTQEGSEAAPAESRLKPGQTLEDLAEQFFEDRDASDEIRALNGIPAGTQPPSGKPLRLPGQERDRVIAALRVASQALQLARADGAEEFAAEQMKKATASLEQAQIARRRADYSASERLADETWALARLARQESLSRRPKKNRFSVSVDSQGTTRVEVSAGDGVNVTAHKKTATVPSGQAVEVRAGQPPETVRPLLPPPEPVIPFDGSVLITSSIYFRWQPIQAAARYVLLISRDPAGLQPVRQLTTETTSYLYHSSLTDGTYFFFLRTVDTQGLVGQSSAPRRFVLQKSAAGSLGVETAPLKPQKKGP